MNSSTSMKQIKLTRRELLPVDIPPVGFPVKPVANVAFDLDESFKHLLGAS